MGSTLAYSPPNSSDPAQSGGLFPRFLLLGGGERQCDLESDTRMSDSDYENSPRHQNTIGSAENRVALESAFYKYDIDHSGTINSNELRNLCSDLDVDLTDDELRKALFMVDKDNSGVVDLEEFIDWWSQRGEVNLLSWNGSKRKISCVICTWS